MCDVRARDTQGREMGLRMCVRIALEPWLIESLIVLIKAKRAGVYRP